MHIGYSMWRCTIDGVDARIPHNLEKLNIIKELNNGNILQIWVTMANNIRKFLFLTYHLYAISSTIGPKDKQNI
jgi:murein L,D-transpeptidase YafK